MAPSAGGRGIPLHTDDPLSRYAFGFAFIAAAGGMVSIALAHTCLAIALLLLLISKTPLRVPPIAWPLAGFLGWTVAAALVSGDPSAGFPQFKKFFVFTMLVVVCSLFRTLEQARRLVEAWFALAAVAALWAIAQFGQKWIAARAAGADFYIEYSRHRITGFFSHWMTFSQALLLVSVMLLSYLLFSTSGRRVGRGVWLGCGVLYGTALVLSFTRSVWIGAVVAGGFLLWNWRRRLLLALPVVLALTFVVAPGAARRRLESIVQPGPTEARLIMWRTGLRMIQAYPWFGVGPERVGPRFREFLPADVEVLPDAYYSHLHNIYVHYAAERGLPAVFFLLWVLGKTLWDHGAALRQLAPARGDQRFLLLGVIAATIAIMVVGCFDVTLGDSEVLGIYLALLALGYRTVEIVRQQSAARGA